MNTATAQLYETDFYGWIQNQADSLRIRNLSNIDYDNLIEEIESMGKSLQRELISRLEILFSHLLRWRYQPKLKGASWELTIGEQREKIVDLLSDNPSLKSKLDGCIERGYRYGKRAAMKETGIDQSTFPEQCPWTFEQVMDPAFWPDPA